MTRRTADPAKAIGYIRVSTDEQHLGPDAQHAAMVRWAEAEGVELVAVHVDRGVSGGSPIDKRPALLAAVDALTELGAGVLLVAKRDRLARDVVVAAMVERLAERAGARIVSADGTGNGDGPEAQLMRGIVDVFAQYERAIIRARTRAALAAKQSKGERTGSVPLGFRLSADGVHLTPDPVEQRALAIIRELRADGMTYRAIVAHLNDNGVPARGQRWHLRSVQRVLAA